MHGPVFLEIKPQSNYHELKLLRGAPEPAAGASDAHQERRTPSVRCLPDGSQPGTSTTARTQESISVSMSPMQHKEHCGNLSNWRAAVLATNEERFMQSPAHAL